MEDHIHEVSAEWKQRAFLDEAKYEDWYRRSIADPEGFWAEHGKRIDWIKPFTKVKNTSFGPDDVSIKWFEDGTTNVASNCIDRHLPKRGDQIAIIWEGDDPSKSRKITYRELHERGLPLRQRPETARRQEGRPRHDLPADDSRSGLRDARLRAHRRDPFHRVRRLLAGLRWRAASKAAESQVIITADEGLRGGRKVPLKANVDAAIAKTPCVEKVIVVRRTGGEVAWTPARDVWLPRGGEHADQRMPARSR